ncbi:MAG: cytochrome P450 [Chloroflexota bacterium]
MDTTTNITFDILNPKTRSNPQAMYEQMRQEAPVYHTISAMTGNGLWFFTRYDDAVAVLKDARFGKDYLQLLTPEQLASQPPEAAEFDAVNRHMLNLDPPDHTRLRDMVHKAFTPRIIENLRPRIQQIADDLLDAAEGQHEFDLLEAYGFLVPITVIAELLGIPVADRERFREWTKVLLFSTDQEQSRVSVLEFAMYMHEMIEERQKSPKEDLISGLVAAENAGDKLDRQELLSMIFLLLVAGHETTVNLIGNGTLALLQNRDQFDLLRSDPTLIKSAVEEMLRYNGPVETPTPRWAFENVQFGDQVIHKGDMVLPSLLGANRDPAYFADPNRFDIRREPNKHIAFGNGIHYCLGAPLARLEGSIAINTLLQRRPNLELNTPVENLTWNESILIHGMNALPVKA